MLAVDQHFPIFVAKGRMEMDRVLPPARLAVICSRAASLLFLNNSCSAAFIVNSPTTMVVGASSYHSICLYGNSTSSVANNSTQCTFAVEQRFYTWAGGRVHEASEKAGLFRPQEQTVDQIESSLEDLLSKGIFFLGIKTRYSLMQNFISELHQNSLLQDIMSRIYTPKFRPRFPINASLDFSITITPFSREPLSRKGLFFRKHGFTRSSKMAVLLVRPDIPEVAGSTLTSGSDLEAERMLMLWWASTSYVIYALRHEALRRRFYIEMYLELTVVDDPEDRQEVVVRAMKQVRSLMEARNWNPHDCYIVDELIKTVASRRRPRAEQLYASLWGRAWLAAFVDICNLVVPPSTPREIEKYMPNSPFRSGKKVPTVRSSCPDQQPSSDQLKAAMQNAQSSPDAD